MKRDLREFGEFMGVYALTLVIAVAAICGVALGFMALVSWVTGAMPV